MRPLQTPSSTVSSQDGSTPDEILRPLKACQAGIFYQIKPKADVLILKRRANLTAANNKRLTAELNSFRPLIGKIQFEKPKCCPSLNLARLLGKSKLIE